MIAHRIILSGGNSSFPRLSGEADAQTASSVRPTTSRKQPGVDHKRRRVPCPLCHEDGGSWGYLTNNPSESIAWHECYRCGGVGLVWEDEE